MVKMLVKCSFYTYRINYSNAEGKQLTLDTLHCSWAQDMEPQWMKLQDKSSKGWTKSNKEREKCESHLQINRRLPQI